MNALFDDPGLPEVLVKTLAIPGKLWQSPRGSCFTHTGSRSFEVEKLEERVKGAAEKLGMTRVANITGLDTLEIPVYSSFCPTADEGLITVFNGKGVTMEEARVSCCMELIERISASPKGNRRILENFQDISRKFDDQALNPSLLILHPWPVPIEVVPIAWTWAFDLGRDRQVLVPATAIFHPYYDEAGPLFINNSCGLAAGSSLLEAVIQALYEVIERDAVSLATASTIFTSVPKDSIDSSICQELLATFKKSGIEVSIKELTTDLGIPVYAAVGDDRRTENSYYLNGGYGCHANREIALTRALTELAQSRATIIAGAREDIPLMREGNGSDYHSIRDLHRRWFTDVEPCVPFKELPSYPFTDLWEELRWMTGRVQAIGLPGPIVADLTREEVKIPVVRVLVPGLECWHRDSNRIGSRLIKVYKYGLKLGVVHIKEGEGKKKEKKEKEEEI